MLKYYISNLKVIIEWDDYKTWNSADFKKAEEDSFLYFTSCAQVS